MRPSAVIAVLALAGCGAASERDVHALYASLQVEEARVAAAEHTLTEGPDEARDAACDEACDAASAAGALASRIDEHDARVRAEATSRICVACREAP